MNIPLINSLHKFIEKRWNALPIKRKLGATLICLPICVFIIAAAWLWLNYGAYGVNVLWRRGGTYWITVKANDSRLSPSMRLTFTQPQALAQAGPFTWRTIEKGFDVAELPVILADKEVDRILLGRIDPQYFRFVVRNVPRGNKGIDEWEKELPQAVLIVNGSFYSRKGLPDTPFLSNGKAAGPKSYDAKAGTFVASEQFADVKDLTHQDWQSAFAGANNAMVAYPLLIGDDGKTHVSVKSNWLANRTFVGKDEQGRIIIGTTKEAYFSLWRLAEFLKAAPLQLKTALNLDGGPVACQSVRLTGYQRKFYALWEAQDRNEKIQLLRWPFPKATWGMPIILFVERK